MTDPRPAPNVPDGALEEFAPAIVEFANGSVVTFTSAHVYPANMLRVTLRQQWSTTGGTDVEATDVAYYSAGSWCSVQCDPTGALVVCTYRDGDTTRAKRVDVVAVGVCLDAVRELIIEWLRRYSNAYPLDEAFTGMTSGEMLNRMWETSSRVGVVFMFHVPDGANGTALDAGASAVRGGRRPLAPSEASGAALAVPAGVSSPAGRVWQ